MIPTADLEQLARSRLREARTLFGSRQYDGAAYLCGYAIELALKARVYRHLRWPGLPETRAEARSFQALRTHDLEALLELSGARARITTVYLSQWTMVSGWNPEMRYQKIGTVSRDDARRMIEASAVLLRTLL
jgi:HEPN domain-containing protein